MSELENKYGEYIDLLQQTLSKKRFAHSMNVAELAVRLAEINNFDKEKAYVAGLLHDIKKEETLPAQKSQAILADMNMCDAELSTPALWHGPAGAYYIRKNLGIDDEDILAAVRYHTAANADMSVLQKIVYLADLTSADRDYPDVEKYRKYALDDLDLAMYHSLKSSIEQTLSKCGFVPECTIAAYNFYTTIYRASEKFTERKHKK